MDYDNKFILIRFCRPKLSKCLKARDNRIKELIELPAFRNIPISSYYIVTLPKFYVTFIFNYGETGYTFFVFCFAEHTTKYETLAVHFTYFMRISCFINATKK